MKNSLLRINGKKLADRWDIETIDLMYIMMNHGLNVVDKYYKELDIWTIIDDSYKNRDLSDYMFKLPKIKDIENNLKVDGEIPHAETIRGKDLMVRWDINEAEIHSTMFDSGLAIIDPFGYELDRDVLFFLVEENVIDFSDLLFRLSDLKEFESEYPEIIADRVDNKKPEKKLRLNQLHRIKCREVAQKFWDEDPTITIIEMSWKDEINALFDGRSYAEKTIRNWIKDLCPDRSPEDGPKESRTQHF